MRGCLLDDDGFYPRTHARCDQIIKKVMMEQTVSIHAPTQGATQVPGGDKYVDQFLSTHPRKVRLLADHTDS